MRRKIYESVALNKYHVIDAYVILYISGSNPFILRVVAVHLNHASCGKCDGGAILLIISTVFTTSFIT